MATQVSKRSPPGAIPVLLNVRTLSGQDDIQRLPAESETHRQEVHNAQMTENPTERSIVNTRPLDFTGFADPDKPLTLGDKIKLACVLIFLYGMFVTAVILTHVYNKDR